MQGNQVYLANALSLDEEKMSKTLPLLPMDQETQRIL